MFWNIRAGGGRRAEEIAAQIDRWEADVAALCEYRLTPPGLLLAEQLADLGLMYQRTAGDPHKPASNAVFIAAKQALRTVTLKLQPSEPHRWLLTRLADGPWIGAMHAPNYVTGRKRPYFDSVLELTRRWRGGPALIGGDTNTGVPPLDGNPDAFRHFEKVWIPTLERRGWYDTYRRFEPRTPMPTWYSPNAGNGYRLDQAFANRAMLPRLKAARYEWGQPVGGSPRRDALSDHAALIIDLVD